MRKLTKLAFEELEKELQTLSAEELYSTTGGQLSGSNGDLRIHGGTLSLHGDGVFYRGDDGYLVYFSGVSFAQNSYNGSSAYQLDGTIYIGADWASFDINAFAHEYGHFLQQQQYGDASYYQNVAIPSFVSGT